jgi:hypothetical protein
VGKKETTMKTRSIVTGLLGLSLGACASGPGMKTAWIKDGANRQDFYRDHYACAQAHQPGMYFGWGLGGLIAKGAAEGRAKDLRRACLRAQGWDLAEIPKASPDGFEEDDD